MEDLLIEYRAIITNAFELLAALSGSYYYKKIQDKRLRIFVHYLWLTTIVEIVGSYSYLMLNNYDYQWFIAIKNSVFCSNIWLYNIYAYLAMGFISIFYYNFMTTIKSRTVVLSAFIGYSVFSILYYTLTDAFFITSLPYHFTIAVAIISLYVLLYFLQLINSDKILDFYKLPSFYISIGLLLWYLCVIPLFIFNGYFKSINSDFGRFRALLLLIINICTYSWFAFGFLYPLYKRKQ